MRRRRMTATHKNPVNLAHIESVRVLASVQTDETACAVMRTMDGCVAVDGAPTWTVCVPVGPARLTFTRFNDGPEHASPLVTGTFGVLPPGHSYSARHDDGRAGAFVVFVFDRAPVASSAGHLKGFYQDEALARWAAEANGAHDHRGDAAAMFNSAAIDDLTRILKHALARTSLNAPTLSARVDAFVSEWISEPFRVDQIARALGCSAGHLSRRLRIEAGRSPWESVVAARIERAKLLLRYTDWPMAQIASVTGFFDQSHFSTSFRRSTALTPKQYRRSGTRTKA
jgi:AraC-like DNA-binding protein